MNQRSLNTLVAEDVMKFIDNKPLELDKHQLHLQYPTNPQFPPLQIKGEREKNKAILRWVPRSADMESIRKFLEETCNSSWENVPVADIQYAMVPGVVLVEFKNPTG